MTKPKRGDVDPITNLVFWAKMGKKEYWVSPDDFALRSKQHKQNCKEWVKKNAERVKNYRGEYLKENQWKVSLASKTWREKNKERYDASCKAWREKNKDVIRRHSMATKRKYKEKITAQSVAYASKRRKENPMVALTTVLRNRTAAAFRKKRIAKDSKTLEIIGCSWEELKSHIDRQMLYGMTWGNRGEKWHIDHIIPLASAKTANELKRLCHYTNLRPLWASENLSKGSKEITHQMALI